MADAEKPFACDVSGCGIKFVCEDKLTSHKRRHKMMLSLNFANTGAGPRNCIEQTPTPTRFMDIIEEAGLFQELQPEFTTPEPVHAVNPFEADFRRASSGEIVTKEPSHIPTTSEPLNTPCILPVTADPLSLRGQFTPASAVPEFGRAPLLTLKAEVSNDSTSAPSSSEPPVSTSASTASESSISLEEATVVAAALDAKEEASPGPIISDKPTVLQVSTPAEAQAAVTGTISADSVLAVTSPVAQVLPGVSTNKAAPVVAPVIAPTVTPILPPVGSLPGSKATTIITPSNVIQIGDSVQLLIVANSAPTIGAATRLPAESVPLLQQNTETKLKDTLVVKGLSSTNQKQATKCALPTPQMTKPPIAASDPNLSDRKHRCIEAVDDERKKKNRENNRYAAQRSRAKKKRQCEAMRKELDDYKKLCADLTARNLELMNQRSMSREMELQYKDEIFKLRKQLALHSSCSITLELQKKEKDRQSNQGKPRTEIVPQGPAAITLSSTLALPTQLSLVVAAKDPLTRTVLK
ncbi:uncharacterized protein [Dermacentor andersoni]|uniref:uncharacterized protein n=1 Tax=Dermacentor andersoni TaxID=34620 RepID=UPI0021551DE2|nr:cyclic AMP-dependent transcription factor ATF-7-like [Dermacentor andersoni]